jgi:hypothetical protein
MALTIVVDPPHSLEGALAAGIIDSFWYGGEETAFIFVDHLNIIISKVTRSD